MILFPAIDIRDGKCVRLVQGDYNKQDTYGDPVEMAEKWASLGAEALHLVDLDGALKGVSKNGSVIKAIVEATNLPVQVGGGIRTLDAIERLQSIGVNRVILGTAALENPPFLEEALSQFQEVVAVSIDAKNGFVATNGWTKTSGTKASDFAKQLEELGVQTIIYTDIAKDGMLAGPNFQELHQINEHVDMNVIASGGITSLDDVEKLADQKLYGAILGKALYTGTLSFVDALKEVK